MSFGSDTTGEKPYEEFFTSEESLTLNQYENWDCWLSRSKELEIDFDIFINDIDSYIFKNFSKDSIISLFKRIIPEFDYEDKTESENKM